MAYVNKKIRNMASNFQAPTYIEKGNKRQKKKKKIGMVRREEVEDRVASGICYAFCIFGLIIQGTKISNISFKTN